jgi:hypothetical protein
MIKVKLEISAISREKAIETFEKALVDLRGGNDFLDNNIEGGDCSGEVIDTEEEKKRFVEEAGYDLSDNQVKFCKDAEDSGVELEYDYSGRGMYGKTCPSVTVDDENDFKTEARIKTDNMGLQIIMYAQS